MKKILFVDDEQLILDGLRRMLHSQRKEWDMDFVTSGALALEAMANTEYDVIVSDMRMPEMDGAELLEIVQDRHPGTVRIVLSGHSELKAALRALPVTHQYLSKPCDSKILQEKVSKACNLQMLLGNSRLRVALGGVTTIPSVPETYRKLNLALANAEVDLAEIAGIIEQDVGMTAKLLQLVNSSVFGTAVEIKTIRQAASVLGTSRIRTLALSTEVFKVFDGGKGKSNFDIRQQQFHSTAIARLAAQLLPDPELADEAFLAGMLHDIGHLILATSMPLTYRLEAMGEAAIQPWVTEETIMGITHAELGAYLLQLWGMPYAVVETVANHHRPTRVDQAEFGVLGAVHVADALVRERRAKRQSAPEEFERLDMEYLDGLGVASFVDGWRAIAEELFDQGGRQAA